jgi:hypothetical protein
MSPLTDTGVRRAGISTVNVLGGSDVSPHRYRGEKSRYYYDLINGVVVLASEYIEKSRALAMCGFIDTSVADTYRH